MSEASGSALSAAVLTQVLDKLHHPVLLLDSSSRITYLNAAMVHYIEKVTLRRWDGAQVIGQDIVVLHPDRAQAPMRERIAAVLSGRGVPPRFNTVGDTMFMTYDTVLLDEHGSAVGLMMEKIPVNLMADERVPGSPPGRPA